MSVLSISAGREVLVDDEDLPELTRHRWTYMPNKRGGYAVRWVRVNGRRKTIYMHRQLMCAPQGVEVDHKNGDGLDNHRSNLRLATSSQNKVNRSHTVGLRGVYPFRGRWKAQSKVGGKSVSLGVFGTPEDAAKAYDEFAVQTWGEFARVNG